MGELRKLAYVFYKYDNQIVFTPRFKFRVLVDLLKTLVEHDSSYRPVDRISNRGNKYSKGSCSSIVFDSF